MAKLSLSIEFFMKQQKASSCNTFQNFLKLLTFTPEVNTEESGLPRSSTEGNHWFCHCVLTWLGRRLGLDLL